MTKTILLFFAGSIFLSLYSMNNDRPTLKEPPSPGFRRKFALEWKENSDDAVQPEVNVESISQNEPNVPPFAQLCTKRKADVLLSSYENNPTYMKEIPYDFFNSIYFEQDKLVLDMTRLEDRIVNADIRHCKIEDTKFKLKVGICCVLLCGCSFTFGMKFATLLMKHSNPDITLP